MRHRWTIAIPGAVLFAAASGTISGSISGAIFGAQPAIADLDLRVTEADIQPSVQINEYDNRTVQKYSINNNTYMIKITPSVGAPYYLVDEDGSGDMAWSRGAPGIENNVPQWALFGW